jgi:hypothetical protein
MLCKWVWLHVLALQPMNRSVKDNTYTYSYHPIMRLLKMEADERYSNTYNADVTLLLSSLISTPTTILNVHSLLQW